MSDYVVAVGFETDAAKVKRETDDLAGSVEKVGKAQDGAARSTKDLTSASSQLERLQQLITIRTQKLAEATSVVTRMQARGVTGSKEYTAAIEKQLKAQDQLASAMVKADKLQNAPAAGGRGKSEVGSRLAAIGGGLLTGDAIGKVIGSSTEEFGAFTAAITDNKDLFGAYSHDIDAFGKKAAASFGLSRRAVLEDTDDLGQLFKTLSIGQQQSAEMSLSLVKLSSDLGALNRADPSDVFDALKGSLTGQFDTLKQYNVVLDTASVRQEAVRLGLVHGKDALTASAQAQAAYSLIVKQTGDAQGAFGRSTDVVAKQQQELQAALSNAKLELGKGLTPALIGLQHLAEHTLIPALKGIGETIGFIGGHASTRKVAELLIVLYGATKVVDLLAAAWARVAVAAGGAAATETLAAGAAVRGVGVGGVLTRAGGLAGGGAVGTGVATVALLTNEHVDSGAGARRIFGEIKAKAQQEQQNADALALARAIAEAPNLSPAKLQQLARQDAATSAAGAANRAASYATQALLDPRALRASAGSQPLPGLTDALPSADVDLTALRAAVTSARQGLRVAQGRASSGGGGASAAQIASAEAAVASARAAARKPGGDFDAEQARLRAAEARLSELRRGGSKDAASAAQSEKSLQDARERVRKTTEALKAGEEQVNGLSASTVLDRFGSSKNRSEAEVRNVRKLVQAGVTAPVIEELKKLETTAPGTLANVVKALTPAFVAELNHDAAARRKAADALALLGGQASVNDTQARLKILGARAAKAYHDGWLEGLNGTGFRQGLPLDDTRPSVSSTPAPPTPFPTRPAAPTPVVTLSEASAAAVGNHARAGSSLVAQHTNVFPNVSNFGAAINEAERHERRSRIMGG